MSVHLPEMEPATRRWKVLRITDQGLVGLLRMDGHVKAEGMPADARVVRMWADHMRGYLAVIIESNSFDEVDEGAQLTEMRVSFTRFYPEAAKAEGI